MNFIRAYNFDMVLDSFWNSFNQSYLQTPSLRLSSINSSFFALGETLGSPPENVERT